MFLENVIPSMTEREDKVDFAAASGMPKGVDHTDHGRDADAPSQQRDRMGLLEIEIEIPRRRSRFNTMADAQSFVKVRRALAWRYLRTIRWG